MARGPRKTTEEKIALIDKKIAELEAEKEALLRPEKVQKIVNEALSKMTPEEIALKLGIMV